MQLIYKTLLFIGLIFTSSKFYSQTIDLKDPNLITRTHFYSFDGDENCNKNIINQMQDEIKKVEFVADVVTKYSVEKKSGMLKIITQEKPKVKEGDHEFSPAILKNILLRHHLAPVNYSVENGLK